MSIQMASSHYCGEGKTKGLADGEGVGGRGHSIIALMSIFMTSQYQGTLNAFF